MLQSNAKSILSVLFLFITTITMQAQGLWERVEVEKINVEANEMVPFITDYEAFKVDYNRLSSKLATSPKEFASKRGLKVDFPMPDGSTQTLEVFKSKIMQDGLQAKFPEIQNYKVIATDGSGITGRIGLSSLGFTASIHTAEGRIYIDRFADDQQEYYVSYYTKDYAKDASMLPSCGVTAEENDKYLESFDLDNIDFESTPIKTRTPEGDVFLRTYNLAIGCTGEYGIAKGGSLTSVMASINESVVKLNEIFELEVGVRLILVDNNDLLIHLNPSTDPYTNATEGASLIGQNTIVLGSIIGLDSWDIGHVYTIGCTDVGGIASLGSVCGPVKGNGVTCHYSSNIDVITTRVAAHEMGHQFSASHSFNHCDGENESTSSGYEPGSGHTIMSYAGGCGSALNVANAPYIYYHGINIEQMTDFTQNGNGDCAELIETNNTNPVVTLDYQDGFYIPIETPFKLDGVGFDEENDNMTFTWEEFDLGPLTTPGMPVLDAPQFVSEVPNEDPERIFPAMPKVLTNVFDKLEVLPFYNKDMTFRLTARDNNPEAGGSHWEEVQFYSTDQAGPFRVEYPSISEELEAGSTITVTWDVANTDGELVNSQFVNILLSYDGGQNFDKILKSYTPNDGSEDVVVPNNPTNNARVLIEAADNIFFDVSNLNSKITEATTAGYSAIAVPGFQDLCLPTDATITLNTEQFLGYDTPINFEILGGLPSGAVTSFSENPVVPGNSTDLIIDASTVTNSGTFDIALRAVAGEDTILLNTIIKLTSTDYSELAISSPEAGESAIPSVPTFTWVEDTDADSYIFELSDNPSFVGGVINVLEDDLIDPTYTLENPLFKNTVYFWRVTGVNKCGAGFTTAISTFATEALSCKEYVENEVPINLPSSGTPTTLLETVIVTNGQVSDVNVRNIKGTHNNFKDLRMTLVSPTGTEVLMFDKRCAGATSFDVGFDSESPNDIQCPMLGGAIYKPTADMSVFNGEELVGTWTMKIEDLVSGNGGKVNEYILDICSNASLSAPFLVKNNPLLLGPGQQELINGGRLKVDDNDNDADELIYTLVEIPSKGVLNRLGSTMIVGQEFTQDDLDNNYISYKHDGVSQDPDADKFVFVVDDGEGGWIDLTTFDINLDIANSVVPKEFEYDVTIYPNPTNSFITIDVANLASQSFNLEIIDVLGRRIHNSNNNEGTKLVYDMSTLNSGNYFFKITIEDASKVYKVQLQK